MSDSLRLARVMRAYPGGMSVDVVLYDTGAPLSNVQCMAPCGASSDSGMSGMADPAVKSGDWEIGSKGAREVVAVLGFVRGQPIALGFLYPQVCGMTFSDGRWIWKHPSGAYLTFSADGSTELVHAGGAYIRIGDGGHESLAGKDVDGKFSGGGSPAKITMGTGPVRLEIDPSSGTGTMFGNLTVKGAFVYEGGMTGSGGSGGAAAVIDGSLQASQDVIANNVSLVNHDHESGVGKPV